MSQPTRLRLYKGYNNGIAQGTLYQQDAEGVASAFSLSGFTLALEVYDEAGTVLATVAGNILNPFTGLYNITPVGNEFNALESNQEYYYRLKATGPGYPAGLLFDSDRQGRLTKCVIL